MPQVVTLGDINVDIIASIPRYPAPGGDGLAEWAEVHSGGSAANTATVLARFGVEVGIIGRVGRDALAEQALARLSEAGVDLSCVQRDDEAITGIMFIPVTPDGERTLFGYRGANFRLDPALLDEGYIAQADVFHLSGYALLAEPQRSAVRRAKELSTRPILMGSGTAAENIADFLQYADGAIVGSSLKVDGVAENPVDVERVKRYMEAVRTVR